jgi:hypothetical protein
MAFTSTLGEATSSFITATLVYGASADAAAEAIALTADTSITLTPDPEVALILGRTGSTTIAFAQPLVHVAQQIDLTGSNSVAMVSNQESGHYFRTVETAISFSQFAHNQETFDVSASNMVTFDSSQESGHYTRTAATAITFAQSNRAGTTLNDAITLTATGAVTFSQSNNYFKILAAAIGLSASTAITFSFFAIFPIELTASTSVDLSAVAERAYISGKTEITFTQSAIYNREYAVSATTNLKMDHSFLFDHTRNGVSLGAGGLTCAIERAYAPQIGGGSTGITTPPRPVAPPTQRHSDIVFYYPAVSQCSATSSLTLRTPNFGDRDRQGYDIINRESRGGTLQIFRDDDWPSQRVLALDVSGLKETEATQFLTFLNTTVGREVGFRDWNGRNWKGIIVDPESPIIRTRDDRIDVSIEIEVTSEIFELDVCTEVAMSQSNVYVKTP